MTWQIITADCIEAMAEMDAASVDAIVTDPPYGLEFMGKEWDRLDYGLPQENVWKGRRGKGGSNIGTDDTKPASRHHVALGMGKRHGFKRCLTCGKRQFSGSPCGCESPEWVLEYPEGAPSSSVRAQRWHEAWATAALRVLKPGGHLLAFGGTRTYHRLACAVEDAGFEIRDCLAWMYGSGFPKSLDVSKAIDKAAGAEREITGPKMRPDGKMALEARRDETKRHDGWDRPWRDNPAAVERNGMETAPATPEAQRWQGWGTALKPAFEPIVLARKPLVGSVASNVQTYGTGALNIDGTRIETAEEWEGRELPNAQDGVTWGGALNQQSSSSHPAGRWPANVVLDPEAAALLDEQTGELRPATSRTQRERMGGGGFLERVGELEPDAVYDDGGGGASRFFYCPKADREERDRGLADGRNQHPTVKPVELMRWLCKLVTPPGGLILDPFTGSGSTGIAALREGFSFVGIEREADYVEIARDRIIGDAPLFNVAGEAS